MRFDLDFGISHVSRKGRGAVGFYNKCSTCVEKNHKNLAKFTVRGSNRVRMKICGSKFEVKKNKILAKANLLVICALVCPAAYMCVTGHFSCVRHRREHDMLGAGRLVLRVNLDVNEL